jgi:predicted  nucleic acid-binding Zn-ribbon protein
MSAALGLYRLQQVDSKMDHIQARLKAIRETLENDLELRAAKEAVAKADARHKEASTALKQSEADFEKQRIKIEQTESNLYSGQVHNPKELQDLQMDIVSLKKHLGTLEERELDTMIQFEEAEKVLHEASEKLQRVQANLKVQNLDLTNESDALNKDLESLDSERKAVTRNIDGQAINVYDRLRQQKRGVAVTAMSDDACDACGTTFTPSQQQTARSNSQLFYCPTCGRIIYAG